jgi:hypothetical protein
MNKEMNKMMVAIAFGILLFFDNSISSGWG